MEASRSIFCHKSKMIANLNQVLCVLELAGTFTCTWPASNSSKFRTVLRNVRWTFVMINVILLTVSLVFGIYYYRSDIVILTKSISELTALLEVILDLLFCKMNHRRLQGLIGRIRMYLQVADEQENKIIQSYVDRYKKLFSVIAIAYVSTGISFSLAPLFSGQKLPADGWIPFSVESVGIYWVVYLVQVYCILQTALCIGVDFMITTLFCFTAARLDILGSKMKRVNRYDLLVSCVKEHQEILGFVDDTKAAVQALLFKTNITMGSAVICGAFPLIYNQSLAVTSQFLCMVVSGCGHLYVISWPADDLKESSLRFATSVNDIQWIGQPRKMTNVVLIMMQRSRKPCLITMGGLLPPLSLEYYAHFLTSISSYFMAMRTMIES
ncbi:odorant receptor 46a [Megachile rotundata]|uniref:odorant receptor 46a n=1 Tax=Megachile rotundata TaxID=143995 RepID=UPI003FD4BA98